MNNIRYFNHTKISKGKVLKVFAQTDYLRSYLSILFETT